MFDARSLPRRFTQSESLAAYESASLGPLFAVSDEGSAAQAIVDAAYASAKARALSPIDPLDLGFVLDGERMTSAGEVPIGPTEYEMLSSIAAGRLLCTTNVGVRVNTRLSQLLPEFVVTRKSLQDSQWFEAVLGSFSLFLHTPDGRPRPLTVRLVMRSDGSLDLLKPIVAKLEAARSEGKLGPKDIHRFSLLVLFENEISTDTQVGIIRNAINAAADIGLDEVALDGELLEAARKRLGIQSLLNILQVEHLRQLLDAAHRRSVQLTYRYQLDVESAVRTIWTGLHTARTHGFAAGKYGLVPMTLREQRTAIELLTRWTEGWTAIPAFYVDTPLVTDNDVFDDSRCAEAAMLWLKMARGSGATIALFDSPDRITPRRLIRQEGLKGDIGVLTLTNVEDILAYAKDLGIAVLWSGGITSRQAFELAKRRVLGIFSTSSTASKVAVTAQFASDPRLPAENEPTEFGVRRIHAIIQGGFLSTALRGQNKELAESIDTLTLQLLDAENSATLGCAALSKLDAELQRGWLVQTNGEKQSPSGLTRSTVPVPADAVRVFRGRRQSSLGHEDFVRKLGSVFMPMTVQMQRLYGLTAYLPAVLPSNKDRALPDEVALVFYRTQDAYHEAKRCIGGRAYSEMHELVFDMQASGSGFPEQMGENIQFDRPYHLFAKSIDWQSGAVNLYVGSRSAKVAPPDFAASITAVARRIKNSPGPLDAVILYVSEDWLLWWEHSPTVVPNSTRFEGIAGGVFAATARCLRLPHDLTKPCAGLSLSAAGDFINMLFPRA